MTFKIKICGITRFEDVDTAAELGVDALGLNFVPQSRRRVSNAAAAPLAERIQQTQMCTVALFVDPSAATVRDVLDRVTVDVLQFQGEETDAFCASFDRPYMKGVRVREAADVTRAADMHRGACALLLDAYVEGMAGGTGKQFDWNLWPDDIDRKLVLAGGLTPDNVVGAVQQLNPWAVDVCGGVESTLR